MSKMIPNVTIETMSVTAILVGLLYGPKNGFIYGIVVSIIVYGSMGLLKFTTLLNSLVIATGGLFSGLFLQISPFGQETTFIICLFFRAVLGIVVFWNITSDKFEAAAHAIIDPIVNIVLYMPIFYNIWLILK